MAVLLLQLKKNKMERERGVLPNGKKNYASQEHGRLDFYTSELKG